MIYHLDAIDFLSVEDLDRDDLRRFMKLHDIDLDELLIEDIDIDASIDEITVKHFLKTHDGKAAFANGGIVRETFAVPLLYELPQCLSKFSRHLRWIVPAISTPPHAEMIAAARYSVPMIEAKTNDQPITITVVFDGKVDDAKWAVDNDDVARLSVTGNGQKAVVSFGAEGEGRLTLSAGVAVVEARIVVTSV